jgi:hypothetical protein
MRPIHMCTTSAGLYDERGYSQGLQGFVNRILANEERENVKCMRMKK